MAERALPGTLSPSEKELARRFYYQMALIRAVEQSLLDLYAQGLIFGTVHTSIGQEACAAGVIAALDTSKDVVFSNHRAHGHFIAYSDDVAGLIAEVMGRKTGVCGGVGGSQHLHTRNLYTNGIQGGIVPNAVGAALAEKLRDADAIVVVFLGDGTMGQGTVYESLNVASLWSLPLLFVLEDNRYAQTTPKQLAHAGEIASRPDPFGIERTVVDADDVFRVHAAACAAVNLVRTEKRPYFLALNTYRFAAHSKGDDYRPPDEVQSYRARDPLLKVAAYMTDDERREIAEAVAGRVQAAIELARQADLLSLTEYGQRIGWQIERPM